MWLDVLQFPDVQSALVQQLELNAEIARERAARRVGTTLRDKWHLDSLIGVGGMAAVYAATHRNGMRGAVKFLHPERAADATIKNRFLREGYIANKVGHAGAVRVLDDDEADGSVFLVMELLEGTTLQGAALQQGGALLPEDTMTAIVQVLETLAAAHEKGIVHRDIKPENLFLTHSGIVKILDYGIAGLSEASDEAQKTQTGLAMGTPAYMSPEQARGRWSEVDARSDLWSVGATLFFLLSGTTVHDEGTVPERVAATFLTPARPIASVAPDVPAALAAIVDRALLLDKAQRWQDASAMRDALRAAYLELQGKPMPTPSAERAAMPGVRASSPSAVPVSSRASDKTEAELTQRPARRGLVLGLAAFALLALAVGVRLTVTRTGEREAPAQAGLVATLPSTVMAVGHDPPGGGRRKGKAEALCAAAGVKLGHVLHMEDGSLHAPAVSRSNYVASTAPEEEMAERGAMAPGAIAVDASVVVAYGIAGPI